MGAAIGGIGDYLAQGAGESVAASIASDVGVESISALTSAIPGVDLITLPYTIYNMVQFFQSMFAGVPREAKTLGPAAVLAKDADIRLHMLGDYIVRQYHGGDWVLSSQRTATYNPARYINFLIWVSGQNLTSPLWNPTGKLVIPPPPGAAYSKNVELGYVGSFDGVNATFVNYKAPGVPPNFSDVCQITAWANPGNYNPMSPGQWLMVKMAIAQGAIDDAFFAELNSQRGQAVSELLTAYAAHHGGWENISAAQAQALMNQIASIPTSGLNPTDQQGLTQGGAPAQVINKCDQAINETQTYTDPTTGKLYWLDPTQNNPESTPIPSGIQSGDGSNPLQTPNGQPTNPPTAPGTNWFTTLENDLKNLWRTFSGRPNTTNPNNPNPNNPNNPNQNPNQNPGGSPQTIIPGSGNSSADAAANPIVEINI